MAAVLYCINLLLERAHEFMHEYHTCINKAINSWCTNDIPKSIFFGSTYIERTWLSMLLWNLGRPGTALAAIWCQLGLSITLVEQSHFDQMDKHHAALLPHDQDHRQDRRWAQILDKVFLCVTRVVNHLNLTFRLWIGAQMVEDQAILVIDKELEVCH